MSDYISNKAIRYRMKELESMNDDWYDYLKYFGEKNLKVDYNLEHEIDFTIGAFEKYLDIVLDSTYGKFSDYFSHSRLLTDEETKEYLSDFKKVIPSIVPEDLRVVYYCYYNGVDMPDCFELGDHEGQ